MNSHALIIDEITSGEDITKHYLEETNKKFKIYRYNKGVYAVRFDEKTSKPIDFVHMWVSHKGERKGESKEYQELGRGDYGVVYKKTEDKAVKEAGDTTIHPEEVNLKILEQKFLLKEHNIEKYFVLGLWDIRNKNLYYMPKINTRFPKDFNRDQLKPMFDEFILALKKLNELGYMHPDLSASHLDVSHKNMLRTPEGVMLIDLDAGFSRYPKANSERWEWRRHVAGMDQWIHVYNHHNFSGTWKKELSEWYKNNEGKALSTDPEALLVFMKKDFYCQKVLSKN